MDYGETLEYIYGLEKVGKREKTPQRVKNLLDRLGNPQHKMNTIHVAGTNGKGSTVAMIASILKAANFKVGMFISPHLDTFTERISVNKRKIPRKEVVRQVKEVKPILKDMEKDPTVARPSFFETITGIMFKYFAEQKVELAVLEVGLGGRLDATNAVDSLVSIITNVHLEHTEILGETIQEIASEKGGIIKEKGITITAEEKEIALNVLREKSVKKKATLYRVGEDIKVENCGFSNFSQYLSLNCFDEKIEKVKLSLLGKHQIKNAALAVGAVKVLNDNYEISVPRNAIRKGLKNVKWPGRLEIVEKKPTVILDCAKDPTAVKVLSENIKELFEYEKLFIVLSISADKDVSDMLKTLSGIADKLVLTEHSVMGRATKPTKMAKELERSQVSFEIVDNVKKAVQRAISIVNSKDLVLVTGSVFTVGEARKVWYDDVKFY